MGKANREKWVDIPSPVFPWYSSPEQTAESIAKEINKNSKTHKADFIQDSVLIEPKDTPEEVSFVRRLLLRIKRIFN